MEYECVSFPGARNANKKPKVKTMDKPKAVESASSYKNAIVNLEKSTCDDGNSLARDRLSSSSSIEAPPMPERGYLRSDSEIASDRQVCMDATLFNKILAFYFCTNINIFYPPYECTWWYYGLVVVPPPRL
jgi:hypothetical protein